MANEKFETIILRKLRSRSREKTMCPSRLKLRGPHHKTRDARLYPEDYRVARGEQGVLTVEPYKSELLPCWKFKTPEDALRSARTLYAMFEKYQREEDFVGMDMARKFIQMGGTRSRRYANHASG